MTAPIALQLYTVREELAKDFRGTIQKVAEMGYIGVETYGFSNVSVEEAMAILREHDLKVIGCHSAAPLGENKAKIIHAMNVYGNPPLIIPWQPPELFGSKEGLETLANTLREALLVATENGFKLGYHNHHAEVNLIDGKPALAILKEMVSQEIIFEIDTYWVQTGGYDAAKLVQEFGKQASLLHIKDGPCLRGEPMTAVGEGVMNFDEIVDASAGNADWMIVELDACATDMLEAVGKSYQYLIQKGQAYGKK